MEETIPKALVPTQEEKTLMAAMATGVEYVDLANPILASANRIVTTADLTAGARVIAAQPDVPRNLTATLTDANNSVTATITYTGKDIMGRVITEVQQITLGVGKAFVGTKIFASVTSIITTAISGEAAGDALVVGVGDLIGLPKKLVAAASVRFCALGNVPVAAPVLQFGDPGMAAVNASAATYDGTKILRVAYRPGE